MDEEQIFAEALKMPRGPDRAAFLEESCGREPALRRRVQALIDAHEAESNFLDPSACDLFGGRPHTPNGGAPADARPASGGEPGRIGPYRLIEPVGEGGMGVVYRAEQQWPVRRTVALKIIRRAWTPTRSSPASRPSGRSWR